eukprot:COSAG03_NODE_272_length_9583_cov_5.194538_4_plen_100_part_00
MQRAWTTFEPRLLPLVVRPPALHARAVVTSIHRADNRAVERHIVESPVCKTEHAVVVPLLLDETRAGPFRPTLTGAIPRPSVDFFAIRTGTVNTSVSGL